MGDTSHSFEAYFKRATSPLVVMRLLLDRPMYVYEISQEMNRRSGGKFTMAVLYPVLYRLEEQGYVELERTEVVNGRLRSYYAITDAGRRYFAQALEEYETMHKVFTDLMEGGVRE